jgi:hypothetical protein
MYVYLVDDLLFVSTRADYRFLGDSRTVAPHPAGIVAALSTTYTAVLKGQQAKAVENAGEEYRDNNYDTYTRIKS